MAADAFVTGGAGLLAGLLTGTVKLVAAIVVMGIIIGTAFYVRYLRQFDIKVEIISTRANIGGTDQHKIIFDKAGYLYDKKDKHYYFRLKEMKVDLPVPPFNVLIPTDKGNMIKIWQKSINEYVFLLPDRIRHDIIIKQDGKGYAASNLELNQIDGDVAFWNTKRKSTNKSIFNPESTLMKLLPFIVPVLMFILVIFLTWIVVKKFDVLADVATQLNSAAQAISGATKAELITHSP